MNSVTKAELPLCVDLDGTLIRTDLLLESALDLLRQNPLYVFAFVVWLLSGKARLKREIARRTHLDVAKLPYDPRVLNRLRDPDERREKVLCTASDRQLADAVAAHIGVFSAVLASDGKCNLSGRAKAVALCELYGEQGFDYLGNEPKDLAIWRCARGAIVVNASPHLAERAARVCKVLAVLPREHAGLRTWLKALRLHQWLKNLLVFLPLLAAHQVLEPAPIERAIAAFAIFGLCASGVYLLNDLLDLDSDRRHPRKHKRAFASGQLSLVSGIIVAPLLTLVAFAAALALSRWFALVLLAYYLLTLSYSLKLKRVVMLDVVLLATLYTLRIIAGAVAIAVPLSFWLLAFSMFLFLSLAMLKRYVELHGLAQSTSGNAHGRGYSVEDLALVQSLGGASGYLSVLVLALYINSTASEMLYRHPQVLWLLCPVLLYWISRVWIVAQRGAMHDDPVIFAVVDPVSRTLLAVSALIVTGAAIW